VAAGYDVEVRSACACSVFRARSCSQIDADS